MVLAAGAGRRYGGAKQLEPVGPSGEILSDYLVHDARRAGAARALFVVAPGLEDAFLEHGSRIHPGFPLACVVQQLDAPASSTPRSVPWGTAHALLAAAPRLDSGFMLGNADDYYGQDAVRAGGAALGLPGLAGVARATVAAYRLRDTLSPRGAVSRALLEVDPRGRVTGVVELSGLVAEDSGVVARSDGLTWTLTGDEPVSMNLWTFPLEVLPAFAAGFREFLSSAGTTEEEHAEFRLPEAVNREVAAGNLTVHAIPCTDRWFGLTHPDDLPGVREAIRDLVDRGVYSSPLAAV